MIIDDFDEVTELLKNISYFFRNIDDVRKKLENELGLKELERNDWLHEIEFGKLNAIERINVYSKLENVLHERRTVKNKIQLLRDMQSYSKKYIEKGICGDTDNTLEILKNYKMNLEKSSYTPRIVKDLKCAKKKISIEEK